MIGTFGKLKVTVGWVLIQNTFGLGTYKYRRVQLEYNTAISIKGECKRYLGENTYIHL